MPRLSFMLRGGWILLALPASLWLLFTAQTLVCLSLSWCGFLSVLLMRWGFHTRYGQVAVAVILVILGLILSTTPTGTARPDSPLQHRFTQEVPFPRYILANIIPEVEQVHLGFLVMPYLDRLLTQERARRAAGFTLKLYREMDQDPAFREMGSVMHWAYADLLGQRFDVGHYYLYIPRKRGPGPLPTIVFLHGSAGNFKVYTWVWSRLAEEHGIVIIAPSFGFGNWRPSRSTEVVRQALDDAASVVPIDFSRVYLAGISNGGRGVAQAAQTAPFTFRGLIFLSPVMDPSIISSSHFQEQWHGRPVLVVTGAADERIPVEHVRQSIADLRAGGVDVRSRIFPNEDHFLFFSQPGEVLQEIATWLPS